MEPASLQVSVLAKAELPVATVQLGKTNFSKYDYQRVNT